MNDSQYTIMFQSRCTPDLARCKSLFAKCQSKGTFPFQVLLDWENSASDPVFPYGFCSFEELPMLKLFFQYDNWSVGIGVLYHNLAFVNQNGCPGDWWTLRYDRENDSWDSFESISFGEVIQSGGFEDLMARLDAESVQYREPVKDLEPPVAEHLVVHRASVILPGDAAPLLDAGNLEDSLSFWAYGEYTYHPLCFVPIGTPTAEQILDILRQFDEWYGNTDQDTEDYALEYQILTRMLISDNRLLVNPKYLYLNDPETIEWLDNMLRETHALRTSDGLTAYTLARRIPFEELFNLSRRSDNCL